MEGKIKLKVQGLSSSQMQAGAYALVLAEENGKRRIPIIVGAAEAQSIAIALEHISPPRPLTHDLFPVLFKIFHAQIVEVYIYRFEEGVFYSEIRLELENGQLVSIDSRTSDAIAIALRTGCNIYAAPRVAATCGVSMDESEEDETAEEKIDDSENDEELIPYLDPDDMSLDEFKEWITKLRDKDLDSHLKDAIEDENYERAQMYRDEKQRRGKTNKNQ
jgi:bifunctional DNase/RNase